MDVLKGNFKTQRSVSIEKDANEEREAKFEREALKRLGGSIAFVSRKKIDWELKEESNTKGYSERDGKK
jgi:hypothetical protein